MNKALKYTLFAAALFLTANLIIFPAPGIASAKGAVVLCLDVLIPSLFPFFICSGLFVALGAARRCGRLLSPLMRPVFNVQGSGAAAFVLGIISGYPVGAKVIADLYKNGECSKVEGERMLAFCNNSGPLFVLGAVGVGLLGSPQLGRILYAVHVISAVLVGIAFRFYRSEPDIKPTSQDTVQRRQSPINTKMPPRAAAFDAVGQTVASSVVTMLNVCGFVVLFSVFAGILPNLGGSLTRPIITALLEICGGIGAIARVTGVPMHVKLPVIAFVMSFSGASIILQVSQMLGTTGLSLKPYVAGKLLHGVLSSLLTWLACLCVPIETPAFRESSGVLPVITSSPWQMLAGAVIAALWGVLSLVILSLVAWVLSWFQEWRRS